jgi:hypothetical protein
MVQSLPRTTPQSELPVASAVRTVSVYQPSPGVLLARTGAICAALLSVLYAILFACPFAVAQARGPASGIPGHSNMFLLEAGNEVPDAATAGSV